jgi:hypothetical protein
LLYFLRWSPGDVALALPTRFEILVPDVAPGCTSVSWSTTWMVRHKSGRVGRCSYFDSTRLCSPPRLFIGTFTSSRRPSTGFACSLAVTQMQVPTTPVLLILIFPGEACNVVTDTWYIALVCPSRDANTRRQYSHETQHFLFFDFGLQSDVLDLG